jgi:hypothetical protein
MQKEENRNEILKAKTAGGGVKMKAAISLK